MYGLFGLELELVGELLVLEDGCADGCGGGGGWGGLFVEVFYDLLTVFLEGLADVEGLV